MRVDEKDLPGRQGRLGFAFLMAHRRVPVLREALVDALWPDGDEPDSDTSFTVARPLIVSGPCSEPTDAVTSTSVAFTVWRVCGLV